MDLRTPLARVRGLGSARDGTEHYINQRLTAIALIPLLCWFVPSMLCLATANYGEVVNWVKEPFNTVMLILFIFVLLFHMHIGLHEVFEDYLHDDILKTAALVFMKFTVIVLVVAAVLAILRIALVVSVVGG
jgi:succinate dehydrogenase / fumarate reductase membrane anchor subunit